MGFQIENRSLTSNNEKSQSNQLLMCGCARLNRSPKPEPKLKTLLEATNDLPSISLNHEAVESFFSSKLLFRSRVVVVYLPSPLEEAMQANQLLTRTLIRIEVFDMNFGFLIAAAIKRPIRAMNLDSSRHLTKQSKALSNMFTPEQSSARGQFMPIASALTAYAGPSVASRPRRVNREARLATDFTHTLPAHSLPCTWWPIWRPSLACARKPTISPVKTAAPGAIGLTRNWNLCPPCSPVNAYL